ncbi:Avr9/Cf-9 rapidly elicited protein [Senna tora]|uniref:Avr9/Cf-9 rapidly elicited protein n=1 Tax=Senna tora TaxID=362788 RepID=A0A834T2X4_9FABA|nr:Avr9/Cf-9 rapidly elicited protein [Senna tora]
MENNLPIIAKRVRSIVRVAFFMLRKGISKGKLMMQLNLMMLKRRRKAISNLVFHHGAAAAASAQREYEFSCSNTPNNYFFFPRRHHTHAHDLFACAHAPPTLDDEVVTVRAVLEMLNNNEVFVEAAVAAASPALPGFGRSPAAPVRQLRVTDSPFPLRDNDGGGEDHHVDKAAEEFIKRFYKELRKQT